MLSAAEAADLAELLAVQEVVMLSQMSTGIYDFCLINLHTDT